jgi:hypothetical protein
MSGVVFLTPLEKWGEHAVLPEVDFHSRSDQFSTERSSVSFGARAKRLRRDSVSAEWKGFPEFRVTGF